VGRKIFESVPDLRVGFQRKDLAVDPEAFDPVTAAKLQCPVQSIGIGHTDFGKVRQLLTARKSPQIFCSGSPEFYGFFPEYATEPETDHQNLSYPGFRHSEPHPEPLGALFGFC